MDNPEYTAKQINAQFAKSTTLPIKLHWDGDETREEPLFEVWVGDDQSAYIVEDLDHTFEVTCSSEYIASASGYHKIAGLLIDIIKEDIEADVISLPED